MEQPQYPAPEITPAEPKKSNKTLIIVLVVVGVLLLCCCVAAIIAVATGLQSGGWLADMMNNMSY